MKKQTYTSIIKQAILNIPKELLTQEFLEDFADIWYYNKRMNNQLKKVSLYPNYKIADKAKGTDSLKEPRLYAKEIISICRKHNILVTFFKPITKRDNYANYSLNNKSLTELINQ